VVARMNKVDLEEEARERDEDDDNSV